MPLKQMAKEKEEKGFLKKFGKWAPIIGVAWVLLNIIVPLALLRIPFVHKYLVALTEKLPFAIPGVS
ncbi:Signal peptidase I [Prochlorococcus sp. MIT 1223]|uniref:Signal peptidase I n=1 Tax=Prochlorococcus sp. MIT 1223 TaxID=3096217 RepID=UPI002A7599A7|nr:Signal peptidase I [Prochlorococcus sp. MIT 1223]